MPNKVTPRPGSIPKDRDFFAGVFTKIGSCILAASPGGENVYSLRRWAGVWIRRRTVKARRGNRKRIFDRCDLHRSRAIWRARRFHNRGIADKRGVKMGCAVNRNVPFAVAWVCLLWLFGCASPSIPKDALQPLPINSTMEGDYRIGVDDRVQVSVWRNPDLSVTVPVRPDGKISVPLIGDVQAGGNTPNQVADIVQKKLSAFIREPNVAVIVTELRSHEFLSRVRVTGAVRTPRSLPYRQGMTVLDAVLEAGGPNTFASLNRTRLYRQSADTTKIYDIELDDVLNKGKLDTNLPLRPGDVISVPERLF